MHFLPVRNCGITTHLQHSISKQSACAGIPPSRRHSYAPSETRKSPNQSLQGFHPLPHQPHVPGSSDSPSSSSSASWWGWPWSFFPENLPTSAAEYRGWKNTFLSRVASIDQTGNDTILAWLSKCFNNEKVISQIVVFFLG